MQCAGLRQKMERATRKQDDQHQVDTLDERLYDIQWNLERIHRCPVNVGEHSRVDDLDARLIFESFIRSGRDDPCQRDRKQDDDADNHERMRHFELFLFHKLFTPSPSGSFSQLVLRDNTTLSNPTLFVHFVKLMVRFWNSYGHLLHFFAFIKEAKEYYKQNIPFSARTRTQMNGIMYILFSIERG